MFRYVSKKNIENEKKVSGETKASVIADQSDENIYAVGEVIGEGSISSVRLLKKIKGKQDDKLFVLKIIKMSRDKCPDPETLGKKEQQKLQMFGLSKGGFFDTHKQKYKIIMDYMRGSDLFKLRYVLVTPECKFDVGMRLVQAVAAFHHDNCVHLDIYPKNILFDQASSTLSLVDFETAEKLIDGRVEIKFERRNPFFIAPELLNENGNIATKKWDIFSLGMTLAYWFGYDLQRNYLDGSVVFKHVMSDSGFSPNEFVPLAQFQYQLYGLFLRMTDVNPDLRPDIQSVQKELEKIYLEMNAAKLNLSKKSEGIDWSKIIIEDYRGKGSVAKKVSHSEVKEVLFKDTMQELRDELKRLSFDYGNVHDDVAIRRIKLLQDSLKKLQKEFDDGSLTYQTIILELTALRTEMRPAGWFPYLKEYVIDSAGAVNIDKIKQMVETSGFSLSRHI